MKSARKIKIALTKQAWEADTRNRPEKADAQSSTLEVF